MGMTTYLLLGILALAAAGVTDYLLYSSRVAAAIDFEGWRALALNGAQYIVNPSATVAGTSQYAWRIEQPAAALANDVFIGAINRVGTEAPWNIGRFYGSSYFASPRGEIIAQASEDRDELLVADMNLALIDEMRALWQFREPRRPSAYGELIRAIPG